MNKVFNNITDSLSEEFKKYNLDEVVKLSLSKLDGYDLQINNLVKLYNKTISPIKRRHANGVIKSKLFKQEEMKIQID